MTTIHMQHSVSSTVEGVSVVLPAAGSGSRMQSCVPKQFHLLAGRPVLIHTIAPFLAEESVIEVIVVVAAEQLEKTRELCRSAFPGDMQLRFVIGGSRRQDSVYAGVKAAQASLVMVHDAARPMVSSSLIRRCCLALKEKKAFVVATPVADTLKRVRDGLVQTTVDRTALFRAQTPQGAAKSVFMDAFQALGDAEVTDESALFERVGISVHLVEGEEENFKITRQQDLSLAEALLKQQEEHTDTEDVSLSMCRYPRIGHGFDAHRLADGRKLVLGGVTVPFSQGLAGHSDADVLTHAFCDALLGAIGAGDIGKFFPDNDQQFKNICSLLLLKEVVKKVHAKKYRLENVDITVICQAPKLAPYINEMKENLCAVWSEFAQWPRPHAVNIKATTEEQMGYTGRREGISCHAVVLLVPRSVPLS